MIFFYLYIIPILLGLLAAPIYNGYQQQIGRKDLMLTYDNLRYEPVGVMVLLWPGVVLCIIIYYISSWMAKPLMIFYNWLVSVGAFLAKKYAKTDI